MNDLPIVTAEESDPQFIFDLPPLRFTEDWSGSLGGEGLSVYLAISDTHLVFGAEWSAPWCNEMRRPGQYIEGLWDHDVAEIFLLEDGGTGRYQEFNLSPTGSWWTMAFKSYRVRESKFSPPSSLKIFTENASLRRAAFSIPIDALALKISFGGNSKGNITAYLGSPPQYFSWNKPENHEPDFHHADCFGRLLRIS